MAESNKSLATPSGALQHEGQLTDAFEALERSEGVLTADAKGEEHIRELLSVCGQVVAKRAENALKALQACEKALKGWARLCKLSNSPQLLEVAKLKVLLLTLWADYYKADNRPKLALRSLKKALARSKKLPTPSEKRLSKAKSLLNMSALYSEMGKAPSAVSTSKRALKLLQKDLSPSSPDSSFSRDVAASVVVAFYNIGAAEEAMGKREAMMEAFRAGLAVGGKHLQGDSEVMVMTRTALQEAEFHPSPRLMTSSHFRALLSERKAELHASEVSGGLSPHSKYYSESQLKILKSKQEKVKGTNFVSSDEYFQRRIDRAFGSPKPVPSYPLPNPVEEKLIINSLRLRKRPSKAVPFGERGPIRIKEEMYHLTVEAAEMAQKNEVRMQSRSKTKNFKETLSSFAMRGNGPNGPYIPPQSNRNCRVIFQKNRGRAG